VINSQQRVVTQMQTSKAVTNRPGREDGEARPLHSCLNWGREVSLPM
jgi:hypothetical protein